MDKIERCPSIHVWSDQRCIRPAGHDGKCWGMAQPDHERGTITRAHWWSENGVFKSHNWYETKYLKNAARSKPCQ